MGKPLVVGICGKARAGKDTVAEMLSDYVHTAFTPEGSFNVLISPMAYSIKLMLGNFLFPFFGNNMNAVDDCLYGGAKDVPVPRLGVTPRSMLQTLGTEWGRNLNSDVWIIAQQARIDTYTDLDLLLIPDIRFDNEAEKLCDIVIQIDRPYNPDALKGMDTAGHSSERGISSHLVDIDISNDGSLDELRQAISLVWKRIAEIAMAKEQFDDELNAE